MGFIKKRAPSSREKVPIHLWRGLDYRVDIWLQPSHKNNNCINTLFPKFCVVKSWVDVSNSSLWQLKKLFISTTWTDYPADKKPKTEKNDVDRFICIMISVEIANFEQTLTMSASNSYPNFRLSLSLIWSLLKASFGADPNPNLELTPTLIRRRL